MLRIRHALLEVSNHPNNKKSAIIINNELIITSGCILQPYVRPLQQHQPEIEPTDASSKIIRKLQQCEIINAQETSTVEAQHLNSLNYAVTFDRRKLPATDRRQPHILTRYQALPLYLFSSAQVSRKLHNFLSTSAADDDNQILLSSFLVLTMRPTRQKENFERFLVHISNYLKQLTEIRPLDDVLVMCTPFGLENFYKTISIGKVSNVLGRDNCLFVISNALPLGCEGSAVFNNKLYLIGIIICTSFQRQNENVNLTMAANFGHLFRDFTRQLGLKLPHITLPREPSNFLWERTMVVIEAAGNQGTGTFIQVLNTKFILTCAHVVLKLPNDSVSAALCRSVDGEFQSKVLWRNPCYNQPFDLALLTAPSNTPARQCARLSSQKPSPGQTVFNAGFPYFVNFNLKYDFNPSIFQGRIIKCSPGAIMSDGSVQAGQSGGPMFDQNGQILGVCVSNIKLENVVYPNINTAVPIYEIRSILEEYAKTNDVAVLNNLVANQDVQRTWALETPPIQMSKL